MKSVVRLSIAATTGLVLGSVSQQAQAGSNFSTECTNYFYSCCGNSNGCNICNACLNTENFRTAMQGYGYTPTGNQYETNCSNSCVESGGTPCTSPTNDAWDSDQVESDVIDGGEDYLYTDVTGTTIEYLSMHGDCGDYPHAMGTCTATQQEEAGCGDTGFYYNKCTENSDCIGFATDPPVQSYGPPVTYWPTGLTWGCDTNSGTCSGWKSDGVAGAYDRYTLTCSSNDIFGHGASITNQIYFGEYPGITFGGDGDNGDVHILALDTSCPFALPFIIDMNKKAFTGLHFELGFSTSPLGDAEDSDERGSYFATRLHDGQLIATAWADASVIDDNSGFCTGDGLCTISLTCDTETEAHWRLANETLTVDTPYHSSAPAWCTWYYDCC